MKNLKLLLLFPMFIVCFLKVQSKPTLVDTGKVWIYINRINTIDHPEVAGNIIQCVFYKFTNDTVIYGKTYKKLMESIDSTKTWTCTKFMREDTSKTVYYLHKDSLKENSIYRFGMKKDSTYFGYYIWGIDSITLNGKNKKVYFISDSKQDTSIHDIWLEGIGSEHNPFFDPLRYCSSMAGAPFYVSLLCYFENNILVYHNPSYSKCYFPTITKVRDIVNEETFVYPNPVNELLTISGEFQNGGTIKIYNTAGILVLQQTLSATRENINVQSISKGVYVFTISIKDETVSHGSFIKE